MKISHAIQIFLGIVIGLMLIFAGAAASGYYFLSRLAENPSRPVFPEEMPKPEPEPEASPSESPAAAEAPSEAAAAPSPEPTPEPSPEADTLKPGEYKARVTWSEGLSLRDSPSADGARIGGIAFNKEMIVIEESQDGNWQKVRLPGSEQSGWVKAGNAEKVD
jgi:hypothetical protein